MKIRAYMILTFAAILYGCNFVPARLLSTQVPPATLALLRTTLSIVIVLPIAFRKLRKEPRPSVRNFPFLVLTSFLGISLPYYTLNLAMKYTTGTNASIIIATIPAVTNVILALGWEERLSRRAMIGILISFTGLLFVFSKDSFGNLMSMRPSLGELILVANVISYSIYLALSQRAMVRFSPLSWTVYSLFFGSIVLAPYGLWQAFSTDWSLSGSQWMMVMYMGPIVSGLAVVLSMQGIKRVGSGQAAIFNNLIPVFGILSSVVLLKETLAIYHLLGFTLVLTGVVLSLTNRQWGTGSKH